MARDLLICVATAHEDGLLRAAVGGDRGVFCGWPVRLLRTGVGPVKAAYALTYALATEPADEVVLCGVGGAYPGSGLDVGDVACAASEQFADFGAETPDGFLHAADLG
ncbi:MAG: futalosine hydrolase, partial [Planctomycetota bacterium]|nr:futalosine hydrolase [Planctomycetota bacterium]